MASDWSSLWPAVGAGVGIAGLVGVMATVFARAELSDTKTRLSVIESRLEDMRISVAAEIAYCHREHHETRDQMNPVTLRLALLERRDPLFEKERHNTSRE